MGQIAIWGRDVNEAASFRCRPVVLAMSLTTLSPSTLFSCCCHPGWTCSVTYSPELASGVPSYLELNRLFLFSSSARAAAGFFFLSCMRRRRSTNSARSCIIQHLRGPPPVPRLRFFLWLMVGDSASSSLSSCEKEIYYLGGARNVQIKGKVRDEFVKQNDYLQLRYA